MRLLVDCDTGIDDALMLLYLAGSPEVEVVAVGSVHGNIPSPLAAANSRRVLELTRLRDVPVYVGAGRPLAQPLATSELVHGADGLGNVDCPFPQVPPYAGKSWPEVLVRLARAHPGELTLLATGPLTNVALALLLEPELQRLLARVVVMGGAVSVPGNATPLAEANIWHDPEAADLVLHAGWDLTLVGLDVTMQTILTGERLDRLAAASGPVPSFAWRILQHYLDVYETSLGYRGCALHDPLAAAVALDPSLVHCDRAPVHVELRGTLSRGQTILDRRRFRDSISDDRQPISVAIEVEREQFLERFLQRLDVS